MGGCGFALSVAFRYVLPQELRIATPVCALVRNDRSGRRARTRARLQCTAFLPGMRIATPVCALVRNDMQILARCQRLQGRFSGSKPAVPRYYAGRRQISTCHCEERSDVAIHNPAEGHSKIAVLRANSLGVTNWLEVAQIC